MWSRRRAIHLTQTVKVDLTSDQDVAAGTFPQIPALTVFSA
jgi:hypothetical protein